MKILFIEDEKEFARSLQELLRLNQYAVDMVHTGEEGLKMLEKNEYDLMILDIMLPGIDGFKVAKKIHQEGIDLPIIMLTARDAVGDRVRGLDSGADDYLVKPFAFEELLARLRNLTKRKVKSASPSRFRVGDLELNPSNFEVRRAGRLINLSNKEYRILYCLLGRVGSVVTREELKENVWGNEEVQSNAIDVHVRYLREKIDKGHANKLICTIRGRGYKLDNMRERERERKAEIILK